LASPPTADVLALAAADTLAGALVDPFVGFGFGFRGASGWKVSLGASRSSSSDNGTC
jgi:hypothetical protein